MATEPSLVGISKAIDLIAVEVAKNHQETIARFESIDRRFEGVDRRFDQMDRRLGRLESRLEDIEDGQKTMRVDIAELKVRSQ